MGYGYAALAVGAVPLAWCASLRRIEPAWWWMAAAFGVSFVADALSLVVGHTVVSQVYPVAQAALFLAVLVERPAALYWIGGLLAVAGASLAYRLGEGLELPLHAVAWLAVAVTAVLSLRPSLLRNTLGAGFAALTLAWAWFYREPTFAAWGTFQAVRVGVTVAWCVAATRARRAE